MLGYLFLLLDFGFLQLLPMALLQFVLVFFVQRLCLLFRPLFIHYYIINETDHQENILNTIVLLT